eukprot:365847-Chlamydomonas_euryale.AAC.10
MRLRAAIALPSGVPGMARGDATRKPVIICLNSALSCSKPSASSCLIPTKKRTATSNPSRCAACQPLTLGSPVPCASGGPNREPVSPPPPTAGAL